MGGFGLLFYGPYQYEAWSLSTTVTSYALLLLLLLTLQIARLTDTLFLLTGIFGIDPWIAFSPLKACPTFCRRYGMVVSFGRGRVVPIYLTDRQEMNRARVTGSSEPGGALTRGTP